LTESGTKLVQIQVLHGFRKAMEEQFLYFSVEIETNSLFSVEKGKK
jgi:hypothetical protein